ncbi:MAG: hypothetical protein LBJ00_17965 [Planctomycetaceae bacterium]|jgi:hypothetical protein|nr:hypothetical protein [Planctomycetaceae bacterium]
MKNIYRKIFVQLVIFLAILGGLAFFALSCCDAGVEVGRWKIESVRVGVEGCYKNGLWALAVVDFSVPECVIASGKDIFVLIDSVDSDGTPVTYRKKIGVAEIFEQAGEISEPAGKIFKRMGGISEPSGKIFEQSVKIFESSGENSEQADKNSEPADEPQTGIVDQDTKPNSNKNLSTTIYFRTGRDTAPIVVKIESDQKILTSISLAPKDKNPQNQNAENFIFQKPIPNERQIILVVGNEDIGLQGAIAELALREERRPFVVKVESVLDLPDEWFGYEAVDLIVLTTTEPEKFKNLHAKSPQITAIDKWVKLGGRMLFCAGRDSEVLLAKKGESGLDSPLLPFLAGKFEKMTDIRKGDLLETFVQSKRKIQIESADDFMMMPSISTPKGLVLLKDGDLPVLSQYLHGFGTITYFGGDLSGKPLGTWRDRTTLVRKILRWDTERQNTRPQDMSLIQPAYNDVSGQIRSATDKFDEVQIVPFSLILVILAVYWLAVSAGDWFVVRKIFKRPMLTWITFPFWILLFCTISYFIVLCGRPSGVILREIVVVDVEPEQNVFRSSVWGNLYSPLDASYSLSLSGKNKLPNIPKPVLAVGFSPEQPLRDAALACSASGISKQLEYVPVAREPKTEIAREPKTENTAIQKNTPELSGAVAAGEDEILFFSWQGLTGNGLGGMNPKTINPTVWKNNANQNQPDKIENVPIQTRSTKSFYGERFGINKNIKTVKSNLLADEGLPVGELLFEGLPAMRDVVLVYGRWLIPIGQTPEHGKITIDKKSQRQDISDILLTKTALDNDSLRHISNYNTLSTDATYIVKMLSVHEQLGGYETIGLFNTFQRSLDMSGILATNHAILIGEFNPDQIPPDGIEISDKITRRTKTILRQVLPVTPTKARTILGGDTRLETQDQTIQSPIKEPERKR